MNKWKKYRIEKLHLGLCCHTGCNRKHKENRVMCAHHLKTERLRQKARRMNTNNIWTDKQRMGGKPCIKNTRFTIAQLLAELADGKNAKEIAKDFNIDLKSIEETLHELANTYAYTPH